jgi:hypothetical protein
MSAATTMRGGGCRQGARPWRSSMLEAAASGSGARGAAARARHFLSSAISHRQGHYFGGAIKVAGAAVGQGRVDAVGAGVKTLALGTGWPAPSSGLA